MAKFRRYDYQWDNYGKRRSEEELDRMEEQFNINGITMVSVEVKKN